MCRPLLIGGNLKQGGDLGQFGALQHTTDNTGAVGVPITIGKAEVECLILAEQRIGKDLK